MRGCGGGWLDLRLRIGALVALAMALGPAGGEEPSGTFEILDDSFEAPDITGKADIDPPGWKREHSYSRVWDENTGLFTTPFGAQAIAAWSGTGFQTTNLTDVLQPGTTYTLTFNVGNCDADTGNPRSDNQYTAELLVGTNTVASVSGLTNTDDLSQSNSVVLATGDAHPQLGQKLGIRLRMTGGDWHALALFDNVRLVARESNEWARSLFYGK